MRKALGEGAFGVAWAAGRGLSPESVVAEVLAGGGTIDDRAPASGIRAAAAPAAPPALGTSAARLTRREAEVLRLLVEGRTDKAIAAALAVSRPTASKHVASVITKLGASGRAAAAAIAVRDGLV